MKVDVKALEQRVQAALENSSNQENPLYEVLNDLWQYNQSQWQRAEQVIKMSDAYQDMMLRRERSLAARFDKHLRQLEKMARISDRYQHAMREANQELERASTIDQLTDLPNRRSMMRLLSREVEQGHDDLKVAMVDIDYFKRINDQYGHLAGDEVLVMISDIMLSTLGDRGTLARWGGEEFIILFNDEPQANVIHCLNELVKAVRSSEIDIFDGAVIRTSISVGLTQFFPGDTVDSLIGRVDQVMYQAKNSGRGCICTDLSENTAVDA